MWQQPVFLLATCHGPGRDDHITSPHGGHVLVTCVGGDGVGVADKVNPTCPSPAFQMPVSLTLSGKNGDQALLTIKLLENILH